IEASEKLLDTLLDEELYIRRYLILKSPEMLELFVERKRKFSDLLKKIKEVPEDRGFKTDRVETLHTEYGRALVGQVDLKAGERALLEKKAKRLQEEIAGLLREMIENARKDQNDKTSTTAMIGNKVYRLAILFCTLGVLLSLSTAILITRNISSAIRNLKEATEMVSQGRFENLPEVKNRDELGDLSEAFKSMAARLKSLEEMYLDASPLTRLPGGVAIDNILKKRVDSGEPIAFCLIDLDNFKTYNDRYGYARGNELIKAVSEILEGVVKNHGGEGDFIGHIGGDDFAVITSPDRHKTICKEIISSFEERIRDFYSTEDFEKGYVFAEDRQGNKRKIPIVTVSIAVVTNTERSFSNHIEVGEVAADLKEYAKSIPGNVYVIDRRRGKPRADTAKENVVPFKEGKSG
ncbi:MAG: sensor domain-containing diguanylate cyclase, partial [Nitrospirae bacterium]